MRAGAGPEDIAEVAVAVQAYPDRIVGGAEGRFDRRKQIFHDGEKRGAQLLPHDVVFLQIAPRAVSEFLDAEARAVTDRFGRAEPMQAAEIAAGEGATLRRGRFC